MRVYIIVRTLVSVATTGYLGVYLVVKRKAKKRMVIVHSIPSSSVLRANLRIMICQLMTIYSILPIVRPPQNNPANTNTLGNVCDTPRAVFLSKLVLPMKSVTPRAPLEVANVPRSTVAVFFVLVTTVVAKVCWAASSDSVKA
jgi:hypothetical protein